jgi:hypothetical protein
MLALEAKVQRHCVLTHDDPEKCVAVFPRDKPQGVCAEIMRQTMN